MTGLLFNVNFVARQRILLVLAAAACAIASRAIWHDGPAIFDRREFKYLGLLAIAAIWLLLLVITQTNLSGGGWMGDWWEHYQRALFYRDDDPYANRGFGVTARPPAFNLVASTLTDLVGTRFSDYQVISTALGSLALLPALLLFELFRRSRLENGFISSGLALFCFSLVLNPMFATNIVYPWSRTFTSFLMIVGTYCYLIGSLPAAFLCLGVGVVSHYSGAMMAFLICADCFLRRRKSAPLSSMLLLAVPIVPWVQWAIRAYGLHTFFTANTTAQNYNEHALSQVLRQWLYNLETTFVPFVRFDDMRPFIAQASRLGAVYDALHLYWASNFWGSLTTALSVSIAILVLRAHRELAMPPTGTRLLALSAVATGLSFVVAPNPEISGITHLTLQHIAIGLFALGFALISDAPAWLRRLFALFFLFEAWGFYLLKTIRRSELTPEIYSAGYRINWTFKQAQHLQFLSDRYPQLAHGLSIALIAIVPIIYGYLYVMAFEQHRTPPSSRARIGG
jgi:hypothetical protein